MPCDPSATNTNGVVVCGAPRSGTSMMAQVLADSGFLLGVDLIAGSASNPQGFFEDIEVNRLNDEVLGVADIVDGAVRPPRPLWWLGAFQPMTGTVLERPERFRDRIPPVPYVIKDPRFSHTYPTWKPLLGEHRVVVMVRPVAEVHESLTAMAQRDPDQFGDYDLTRGAVEKMWVATYDAIDRWADDHVAYVADSSLRNRSVLGPLSEFLGRPIAAPNVTVDLRRSTPARPGALERPVFARCM